jgi:hypothetical protein
MHAAQIVIPMEWDGLIVPHNSYNYMAINLVINKMFQANYQEMMCNIF